MVHSSAFHGYLWVVEYKYRHEEKWRPFTRDVSFSRRAAREWAEYLKPYHTGKQFRVALYQKVPWRS